MRSEYLKFIFFIFFITCIGLLFPFLMIENFQINQILSLIITLYSALRLSFIIMSKEIRILEVTFYIFVYAFLGIAPLVQIGEGQFPWSTTVYSSNEIMYANIIILLGILGFEIGLKLFSKNIKREKVILNQKFENLDINFYYIFLLISTGLFFIVTIFIGLDNIFTPRNNAITEIESSSYLLLSKLQEIPLYVALILGIVLWKNKTNNKKLTYSNIIIIFIIFILLIFNLVLNNPISSARFWVGTIYMSIILILIKWKPLTQPLFVILLSFVFLFVFPYADIFRNSLELNLDFDNISSAFAGGDYDAFQQIMNTATYTNIMGYSLGYQLLGVIFFWVPRVFWENKPFGTGWTIGETLDYNFLNISAPLWSEFYINFSHIGVLLLFILYGYFIAYLQKKYQDSIRYKITNFYSIFVPIFSGYQIFMLRGDLLSTFAYLFPILIFILFAMFLRRYVH